MKKTKKIAAIALIALMAILTISTVSRNVKAFWGDTSGNNPAWRDANPHTAYYCQCMHESYPPGSYTDAWVSTGVDAYYDQNQPAPPENETVGYIGGYWCLQGACGDYWWMDNYLYCILSDNGNNIHYYNYPETPTWQTYGPYTGWMHFYIENYTFNPIVKSVEGGSGQAFADPNNPPYYFYEESDTIPWSYMAAWYNST